TYVGVALILASTLNGIAVVRAYFSLFTGTRHASTVSLSIGPREWVAMITLTVLIVGWGVIPQPGIASRYRAALSILEQRKDGKAHSARKATGLSSPNCGHDLLLGR